MKKLEYSVYNSGKYLFSWDC